MDRIMQSNDRSERGALFEEMKTKLLAHAHAEQEVLYRPLEAGEPRRRGASPTKARTSIRSSNSNCKNYPPTATKRANSGWRSLRYCASSWSITSTKKKAQA